MSDQIRKQVTDRILKALAEGLVPWGRPNAVPCVFQHDGHADLCRLLARP
jgi:hypothetical protein